MAGYRKGRTVPAGRLACDDSDGHLGQTGASNGLPCVQGEPVDTSVWWSGDLSSAMRTTLGAGRAREHLEAHAKGDTVTHTYLRAEQVVDWATRGGARALGRDDLGRLEPGVKADLVLIKNDASPVSFPLLNPYGQVVFQAQRRDVHTVIVDGKVVKHEHRLVGVMPGVDSRFAHRPPERVAARGPSARHPRRNGPPGPRAECSFRCHARATAVEVALGWALVGWAATRHPTL
jgi:hypothetical protein